MSIYAKDRTKKLAEEQMEKDLKSFGDGDREPIMPNGYILSKEEFNMFWIIFQASKYTTLKDFFKHWTFYLSDDVGEEIICEDEELNQMYCKYDFDKEECLEEAKDKHIINGFCYLGNDLWLINEGDD